MVSGGGSGSVLKSLYKGFFKPGVDKGRAKLAEFFASIDLDPQSLKRTAKEFSSMLAGKLDRADKEAMRVFFQHAPMSVQLKVVKNLSDGDRAKLRQVSPEVQMVLAYLENYWIESEKALGGQPKIRTATDLRATCQLLDVPTDKLFRLGLLPDFAPVIGIADLDVGMVKFFAETGSYSLSEVLAVIPLDKLNK